MADITNYYGKNNLFIVEGETTAHNYMNFGNYLWGATGYSIGIPSFILKIGAHYNSLFNSKMNGYPSSFDSPDDQVSIKLGARHAKEFKYRLLQK